MTPTLLIPTLLRLPCSPSALEDLGDDWTRSFIARQEAQELVTDVPVPLPEAAYSSELSSEALRDLIELSDLGGGVAWPPGLDTRVAAIILSHRSASGAHLPQ